MFKLVKSNLPDDLTSIFAPPTIDIQLVGDNLANDKIFTWDKSIVKDAAHKVYTYRALHEAIPPQEMSSIRDFIFFILSRLAGQLRFMCFMHGRVPASDIRELENRVTIGGYHEAMKMNGGVIIAEMDVEELKSSMTYFGDYDTMRGVAATADGFRGMYADLRLFEPIPTTDDNIFFQPPRYNAIQIALRHGAFFFEEIGNGTRLRVVSTAMTQDKLTHTIESLVHEWNERG